MKPEYYKGFRISYRRLKNHEVLGVAKSKKVNLTIFSRTKGKASTILKKEIRKEKRR